MGWIARSQLASAVSASGACGIIETSSGELDAVKGEIRKMRDLTDRPFGVNIAQAFVRDPSIAEFVIEQGVEFVTTSAGSPTKYTSVLKEAGLTVYHVVPTLARCPQGRRRRGRRAGRRRRRGRRVQESDPGVDDGAASARSGHAVDVPIIAAGGITDGATMAAAFALGARVCRWAPGWCRRPSRPFTTTGSRRSSTPPRPTPCSSTSATPPPSGHSGRNAPRRWSMPTTTSSVDFGNARRLYFGGDMEAAIALSGQVAGRIDAVRSVADIIADTVREFAEIVARLQADDRSDVVRRAGADRLPGIGTGRRLAGDDVGRPAPDVLARRISSRSRSTAC